MKGEEHKEQIIKLYESGLSLKVVADKVAFSNNMDNLSPTNVKMILKSNGVKIRSNRQKGVWGNDRTIK